MIAQSDAFETVIEARRGNDRYSNVYNREVLIDSVKFRKVNYEVLRKQQFIHHTPIKMINLSHKLTFKFFGMFSFINVYAVRIQIIHSIKEIFLLFGVQ